MSELKKQKLIAIESVVTYRFTITDFEFARKVLNVRSFLLFPLMDYYEKTAMES